MKEFFLFVLSLDFSKLSEDRSHTHILCILHPARTELDTWAGLALQK